jgi:hypothetical protein
MLVFLLASGMTTDICESLGCLLFLGVTIKSVWMGAQHSLSLPQRSNDGLPAARPYPLHRNRRGFASQRGDTRRSNRSKLENMG